MLCWFCTIKFFECQKNTFGIRNTQYSLALTVHKQSSVFNTTYTIQSCVNCPHIKMPGNEFQKILYNWSISITAKINLRRKSLICSP